MLVEVAAKLAAAARGFWWSLDDQERAAVMMTGLYLLALLLGAPLARQRAARERAELLDELLEEVSRRGRA